MWQDRDRNAKGAGMKLSKAILKGCKGSGRTYTLDSALAGRGVKPESDGRYKRSTVYKRWPELLEYFDVPECGCIFLLEKRPLIDIISHLNTMHERPREDIAKYIRSELGH